MFKDYLTSNIKAIRSNSRHTVESLIEDEERGESFRFFYNKKDELTCLVSQNNEAFLMHSKYDAYTEAQRLIDSHLRDTDFSLLNKVIVYGFGCGHHIRYLMKVMESFQIIIEVWEINTTWFSHVIKQDCYVDIIKNEKVHLKVSTDLHQYSESLLSKDPSDGMTIIIHEPSLKNIPAQFCHFKNLLDIFKMNEANLRSSRWQLLNNYKINSARNDRSIDDLIGAFHGFPVILVSAGPSLENNITILKDVFPHAFVCCVGTSFGSLIKKNITPDFFLISDPSDEVAEQIKGMEKLSIPLFYLSTVSPKVPSLYMGPKRILYQEGLEGVRIPREVNTRLRTGGSVATVLFDLLIKLGFNPICLVGQDLAYTNAKTHYKETLNFQNVKLHDTRRLFKVKNYYQNDFVHTPKNLYTYLKWFEWVATNENRDLYNATEGGVYIEGFKHISLIHFLNLIKGRDVSDERSRFKKMFEIN